VYPDFHRHLGQRRADQMQGYSVTVTSPTTFTVTSPQLAVGTYGQTNGVITADISGNALAAAIIRFISSSPPAARRMACSSGQHD
jgi:hypothetical protein